MDSLKETALEIIQDEQTHLLLLPIWKISLNLFQKRFKGKDVQVDIQQVRGETV